MNKIEKFLESNDYPLIVAFIGAIAWILPKDFIWLNNILMIILVCTFVFVLSLFKNTKYIIPTLLSLVFTLNVAEIGVAEITGFTIYHLIVILMLIGLTVHLIRFKHKFEFDYIALGLMLIAISYLIPMAYMPLSSLMFSISITGIIYVLFYLFFISTAKVTTDDVLNYFFFASIQLLVIMLYSMGTNFIQLIKNNSLEETIAIGLNNSWGSSDYGFGNINDLNIHLAILSSGIFYKIIKHPKNYFYWLFAILYVVLIVFSGSRGGAITLVLLLFSYYIMLYVYGTKEQIIIVNVLLFVVMGLAFAFKDMFLIFFENFLQGGVEDMNSFSSGRIQLYKDAIEIFKKYPVFGAGWTTFEAENVNRIQVFHSTIFHTLAISGIFGLISVFIFTVACFTTILKKLNKNVLLLGVPWTITMLHGLIDNTIHMVIYTLLTMVVFTAIRKEEEIIV